MECHGPDQITTVLLRVDAVPTAARNGILTVMVSVPIVVLTARDSESERFMGFEVRRDDFVV